MTKNTAHIDNFKASPTADRFSVVDVTFDPVRGTQYFEVASGKTVEQAKERFYSRYMYRAADREMMEVAQRNNRLKLQHICGNKITLVEDKLTLIM